MGVDRFNFSIGSGKEECENEFVSDIKKAGTSDVGLWCSSLTVYSRVKLQVCHTVSLFTSWVF